MFDEAVTMNN
jgi:hypothetical protein